MKSDLNKQLATLSMYERAILIYCLHAYFSSGNYTNNLPLGEMLPEFAAMFDANPGVNVFAKLADLQMTTTAADQTEVKVFEAMGYQKDGQYLVTILNKQADLQALLKIVDK